jgi:hypothetical protein
LDEDTRLHALEDLQVVRNFAVPVQVPVRYRITDVPGVEADFSDLTSKGRPGSRNPLIEALSAKIQGVRAAVDHADAYDLLAELDGGIFRRDGVGSSSDQATWAALATDPDRKA